MKQMLSVLAVIGAAATLKLPAWKMGLDCPAQEVAS